MLLVMHPLSKMTHRTPSRAAATPTPSPHGPAPTTAISKISCTLLPFSGSQRHPMHRSRFRLRAVQGHEPQPAGPPALELVPVVRRRRDARLTGRVDE